MCRKNKFNSGLTMLEVVIASVIVAITLAGTANLFLGSKNLLRHARSRMGGVELGKTFVNPAHMQVRQDTWGAATNGLTAGTRYCDSVGGHTQMPGCPQGQDRIISGVPYTATYVVANTGPGAQQNLRRVTTTINWPKDNP